MGWYRYIHNLTNGEQSKNEYKYGHANLEELLIDNPTWTEQDIMICHGEGEPDFYHIINIPEGMYAYAAVTKKGTGPDLLIRTEDGKYKEYNIKPLYDDDD